MTWKKYSASVAVQQQIGKTAILTGTKDGVPKHEAEVAVCENCYAVLKQKVRARSRPSD